jgi:hypothetical protein
MKKNIIILLILLVIDFFTLAAILGQVDFQMGAFYNNPNNWWQFPWGRFSAIYAWEQEYVIIFLTAIFAFVIGYFIGKIYKL